MTAVLGLTWRGVFIAMGAICFVAAIASVRLRDPGFGRWDSDRVRSSVREDAGFTPQTPDTDDVKLGFFEIVRRLMLIPTIRRVLVANAVLGCWPAADSPVFR